MLSPNILISIPAYGGSIKAKTSLCLCELVKSLTIRNIPFVIANIEATRIEIARNIIGSFLLHENAFSHLFFVDADMDFRVSAFDRLLAADKPFVGCAYVHRSLNLPRALDLAKRENAAAAVANASRFTVTGASRNSIVNGTCKVESIGMGVTLIKREVFEDLAQTNQIRVVDQGTGAVDPAKSSRQYGFFDPLILNDFLVGEDVSFCHRWRTLCQGEIWAIVDEPIGHIGDFIYSANFMDTKTPLPTQ